MSCPHAWAHCLNHFKIYCLQVKAFVFFWCKSLFQRGHGMWTSLYLLFSLFLPLSIFAATNACLDCHEEEIAKTFKHPAAVEDCSSCHDPDHEAQTGWPHRLYNAPNKLCANCHVSKPGFPQYGESGTGHPVLKHPTLLSQDPLYPKKEFSCISCHNPHSSKMKKLFRYDYSKTSVYKGELCSVCHWSIFYEGPMPKAPPWY